MLRVSLVVVRVLNTWNDAGERFLLATSLTFVFVSKDLSNLGGIGYTNSDIFCYISISPQTFMTDKYD